MKNQTLLTLLQSEASRMLEAYPEEIKSGRTTQAYANENYMAMETAIMLAGGPAPHPSHIQPNGVVVRVLSGWYYQLYGSTDPEILETINEFIKSLQDAHPQK